MATGSNIEGIGTLTSYVPRAGGRATSGLITGAGVVELEPLVTDLAGWDADDDAVRAWRRQPERLERFLTVPDWEEFLAAAADRVTAGDIRSAPVGLDLVRLLQPVHRPEKIIGVGLNYRTHIEEAGREIPEYPMLFAKYANALAGAFDDVPIPIASHRIDYEGELAVIIGRPTARVQAERAMDHVAGFAVANDVSARDYQFRTRQIMQGKAFDSFCPLGPIARFEPGTDIRDWRLRTHVNDELRQESDLADLVFDVPFLIEYISQIMTLLPGDVLLTGTPGGIGAAMDPRRWLRDGDRCSVEVDHVGRIENTFVAAAAA